MTTDRTQAQRVARFIDLKTQHIEAGLDPSDIQHLDTPGKYRKPTMVRVGNHCASID